MRQQIMLVFPIQINGVQSISVSLGSVGFGALGGMMVHNKPLTVSVLLLVTPGSRPPVLIGWSRSNT